MNKLRKFDPRTHDEGLIRSLSRDLTVADSFERAPLTNFLEAEKQPVHRWFYVREGFSPRLVHQSVDELGLRAGWRVLDPFCGGGTTLLTSRERGLSSTGFDVNPLMAYVIAHQENY